MRVIFWYIDQSQSIVIIRKVYPERKLNAIYVLPSTKFLSGVSINMHGLRLENLKNQNFQLQGQKLRPKKQCHKRNMDLCRRLVRYENSWVGS